MLEYWIKKYKENARVLGWKDLSTKVKPDNRHTEINTKNWKKLLNQ